VALCLVVPLQTIYAVIGLEEIYFTYDLTVLAVDGNAVNQDIMNMYRNATIFFILVLSGLVLFHGWALRSSVDLEKSKENYRRYFSPEIGDEIESGDLVIGQDGSRVTDVAVLFTDIAGFTKLSEKMDPQDVLDLLSEYQTLMVDAIFQHKGTVDKFIGDAVMANFGTPRSHGNDAQNAFDCGVLMNHKLAEWNKTRAEKGLSEIQHRIGIHYGKCVVGNMGSEQRLEFAVIGDAVNVASRICDACKNFDTNFLISADVASRITHDVPSEDAPNVGIRGREGNIDLVKIYTERLGA
jgi:adenylate cyclase